MSQASVESDVPLPEISSDDFVRRFSLRSANLMWFLGAGASAAAGIPTALDMIWEFKQQLFISQRRVSPKLVGDLSSPTIRAQLQAHIDSAGTFPPVGAPAEYAKLFETVYPAEADRRAYLEAKIAGAKPSYGHMALATLMRANRAPIAWTTNFDPLIADACSKVYDSTGVLTSVGLEAPDVAAQRISENRWPIEIKLHGDFRSRRLKNTSDELRMQDTRMRHLFVDSCHRFGLVVVGYSGRDNSIMDTLEEVLDEESAFPNGLFWLHRGDGPPLERVASLLRHAVETGTEAVLVRVQNFDEVLRDLLRLIPDLDMGVLEKFAVSRSRRSAAPSIVGNRGWPIVRLNAVPVKQCPTVCRRVVCEIGGYAAVREAVEKAEVDVLVARTRQGVLAYGADCDVRSAFEAFDITEFDLHPIEMRRLRYESGERGLLRDALSRAISQSRNVDLTRRRNSDLLAPSDPQSSLWDRLRRLVGSVSGKVSTDSELRWREGISMRLDWADDRLWLLIEPRIVFDGMTEENRSAATTFARERTVKRYNRQFNELLAFWAEVLSGSEDQLRALGVSEGVDATFVLSSETAFSWRGSA